MSQPVASTGLLKTHVATVRGFLSNLEFWPLMGLMIVAGAVWGFQEIADGVVDGATGHFDIAILEAMRQPGNLAQPIGPFWLPGTVRDITALGSTVVLTLLSLLALGYLLLLRRFTFAAFLAFSVIGGTLGSTFLKLWFERPRPTIVPQLTEVASLSFPSGHAMLSTVVYLTIAAIVARSTRRRSVRAYLVGVAIAISIMVGLSRIYLGVHWPSDVLAGWCAGAAWALACWLAVALLQRRYAGVSAAAVPANPDDTG